MHKTLSDFLNVIRGWGGIYEMALRDVVGTEKMIRGMLKGFIDLLFVPRILAFSFKRFLSLSYSSSVKTKPFARVPFLLAI